MNPQAKFAIDKYHIKKKTRKHPAAFWLMGASKKDLQHTYYSCEITTVSLSSEVKVGNLFQTKLKAVALFILPGNSRLTACYIDKVLSYSNCINLRHGRNL